MLAFDRHFTFLTVLISQHLQMEEYQSVCGILAGAIYETTLKVSRA